MKQTGVPVLNVEQAYDKIAPDYDDLVWSQFWHAVMRPIVTDFINDSHVPGPIRVLDIGTGTGQSLSCIERMHYNSELHGIDASANMLRVAREKSSAKLKHLDIIKDALPYEPGYFSHVLFTRVASHIPPTELRSVFRKIAAVMKPGAKALACDRHPDFPYPHGHMHMQAQNGSGVAVETYNHTINTRYEALSRAGFTVVAFDTLSHTRNPVPQGVSIPPSVANRRNKPFGFAAILEKPSKPQ